MLSPAEQRVMKTFRMFYMEAGEMLCFNGIDLAAKTPALDSLVHKKFLTREKFAGAFSLTSAGYSEMRGCR